ncbi:MAG: phenylalanine--tRNA ligase subunit alpha [Elusimicrobia bacterium]|jgi:phenylalanyl-tRNA synthetase alpha chain|nr:phenylalanine--tRNA ligase subunit alpha [Elusimicrobiota bacterium]
MTLQDEYKKISGLYRETVNEADSLKEVEKERVKYIGRSGAVNEIFKKLGTLSPQERPAWGKKLNILKSDITKCIEEKKSQFNKKDKAEDIFDPTLPGNFSTLPSVHPVTRILREIKHIFSSLGFGIAYGPEIETAYHNFTALNIPKDHAARDMHDTFYLDKEKNLLRTHTSPVQVRVMENNDPPYNIIAPGKCYRRDTIDASHSPVFHQVEGLMVGEDISFSDLKGVLAEFAELFFEGTSVKTRFRPSYFPFTEPSAEMDISCRICGGKGCSSCSQKGWLEVLGAGMVDPEVFKHCDVDSNRWQGFAFGMGVERLAMLKYGINDMRFFYLNDMRFLEQF